MKKYNPLRTDHHHGRTAIIAQEVSAGKYIIESVEIDDDQIDETRQVSLFSELKIEVPLQTIEALRKSFYFREIKFTKSEALTPKNFF
ncbi:MAG TPA: hypothetical protein VD884_14305 [Ohtaekwangia sp.]|nr:hypothetical protein [Ohtaekwangia sp.]